MARTYSNEERIAAKAAVSERLAAVKLSPYRLGAVDPRLYEYCREVIKHPERHNLWEQLGVEVFLRKVKKYGLSAKHVRAFFAFYERLTFVGEYQRTNYKLTPVQAFQFANIYGFVGEDGRRITKEVLLFVPRKFSKTTSCAAVALWDLIFGPANAQCYVGANSAAQAKNCFEVIRTALDALDPQSRRFVINLQEIRSQWGGRSAFAQCLTSNTKTKDGLNASSIIMDEYSQARDAGLLNVLTTSMGTRPEPLTVIITTASELFDGPFYDMLQGYKNLLMGEHEDDSVFAHLFEPDVGDSEGDPATWHKVHPHLGVTVREDFYEHEWAKAQRTGAEALLAFRTKLLNIFSAPEHQNWLTRKQIMEASVPFNDEEVQTGEWICRIGVDLSDVDDFSAMTACYFNKMEGRFIFKTHYYFPEGALNEHPNGDLYRKWVSDGHLRLTPGNVVDYDAIVDDIMAVSEHAPIASIGYDARGATDFANHLRDLGLSNNVFPIPQTYGYFSGPVFFLEKSVKQGNAVFADNPINAYCFGNCIMVSNLDGCKPEKKSKNQKIDGVISALMAARQYLILR